MAVVMGVTDDVIPDLTEEEKIQLRIVMMKAKEFDAQEEGKMRQPLEGQLFKYTNVVKGWQYRWFVLNPDSGYLDYYMMDEIKKNRPRGSVHLAGSVISPSDEDSQTFSVSAVCGEVYRLRASNAKERQFWVNRLRAVAEYHTQSIAEKNPPLPPRDLRNTATSSADMSIASARSPHDHQVTWYSPLAAPRAEGTDSPTVQAMPSVVDAFRSVRSMIQKSVVNLQELVKAIETLPSTGKHVYCCQQDMLLLKATSQATLTCLDQCHSILQQQQVASSYPSGLPAGAKVEWVDSKSGKSSATSTPEATFKFSKPRTSPSAAHSESTASPGVPVDSSGEITDEEDDGPPDLIDVPRNDVLDVLSHLKYGADLTKFSFPVFGLEPRSLLEMYADFLSHPHALLKISEFPTAEERMKALVEWYTTSFHFYRQNAVARKPYNPLIGETFHCSWKDPQDARNCKLTYVAEQVSHHPPVSAWYAECPEKQIFITSVVNPKPQYFGLYAVVAFHGDVSVHLLKHKEVYSFNYPTAYVRSPLSEPWVEFGGRVVLACKESGCHAFVTFQTEPFYDGRDKARRIVGEVKNAHGEVLCKISGTWNASLHFKYNDGTSKDVDIAHVRKMPKRVRPIQQQDSMESRSLWQTVTKALRNKDYDAASNEKKTLESKQHEEEETRRCNDAAYKGKLFQKLGNVWLYKYALQSTSPTSQRTGKG